MLDPSLLGRIYEAASEPDVWPEVLDSLSRLVGAAGGGLLTRRHDAWIGWRHSPGVRQASEAYLRSDGARQSQTTARLLAFNHAGFVTDADLFASDEDYCRDAFMIHGGLPHGLHHAAATAIHVPNGDLVVAQFTRRAGLPGMTHAEVALLDAYRPHLARAGLLAARWRLERLSAGVEALAVIGLPAAVLDLDGRVMAANALIQSVSGSVVWGARDRLHLADPTAASALGAALAATRDAPATGGRSFLARGPGVTPAIAHVAPILGAARDVFAGAYCFFVLTPVERGRAPDLALVQGLFDLSPAEAAVARAISRGLSNDQIAETHGVGLETVRTQVKAVLAKFGAQRRSEVAARLAGLPRLPIARP